MLGGLGDQVKRREIFNWLLAKNIQYILFKNCTVQKTIRTIGKRNWAIKLCSAAAPVKRQVVPYFLIISLIIFQILKHIPIPRDGL